MVLNLQVTHFWIGTHPYMESLLIFAPDISENHCETAKISIFDADGEVVNEVTLGATHGNPVTLELSSLIEGAKYESGLIHTHLVIEHSVSSRIFLRAHTRSGATFLEPASMVDQDHPAFFPVALEKGRSSIIALVNLEDRDLVAKVRLILGGRNPDVSVVVPARGSRLVGLESEFGDQIWESEVDELGERRGYVRASIRGDGKFGVSSCSASSRGSDGLLVSGIGR